MCEDTLVECVSCGEMFKARPHKSNKYCGMACYRVAQRAGAYKRGSKHLCNCSHCGAEIVGRIAGKNRDGSRSEQIFCDRACYDAHRSEIVNERTQSCDHCGVDYTPHYTKPTYDKHYCSMECRNAAKKATPKTCKNCGCTFTPVYFQKRTGKYISVNNRSTCSNDCFIELIKTDEERKKKISAAFTGDKHPLWQGGKSWHSNSSYRGPNWQKQAEKARKRDKYECQHCGKTQSDNGRALDVHHIVPFHNFERSKKANALSNLITLCQSCHCIEEHKVTNVQMTLCFADNKHGRRTGVRNFKGERHFRATLTDNQVSEIRRLYEDGVTLTELIDKFQSKRSIVYAIVKNKSWRHLPLCNPDKEAA